MAHMVSRFHLACCKFSNISQIPLGTTSNLNLEAVPRAGCGSQVLKQWGSENTYHSRGLDRDYQGDPLPLNP